MERLGIEIIEVSEGRCVGTMAVDERTVQPFGYLHGGANVVLAETLASVGASKQIDTDEICFGVEVNANHLRAVRSGLVTGTATCLMKSKTQSVWDIAIVDDRKQLVCVSRCTLAIRAKRKET
ncbi:MAG: PaaI family thioesterase [Bacilli bacterium]